MTLSLMYNYYTNKGVIMRFNKELFRQLIKDNKSTYKKLADDLTSNGAEISEDGIKQWCRTASDIMPTFDKLNAIGKIFKIDPIILISSNHIQNIPSNIILIDKLDMRAGAGSAGLLDVPYEGNKIAIDKMIINGLNPKHLKIIEVIGDSMQPEFQEGDLALLDMVNGRNTFTKIGGIYIVRVNDVVYIKKVEFLPDGRLKLISINKEYGDMIPHEQGYDYEILGKVCGKIHVAKGLTFDNQGIS